MKNYYTHLYDIRWFMGSCSVWDKKTGERLFDKNFYGRNPYEAAQHRAEGHFSEINKLSKTK